MDRMLVDGVLAFARAALPAPPARVLEVGTALIAFMGEHVHPLQLVLESLAPYFVLREPVRGPYLHRWNLDPRLRDVEERLIAAGRLPATGARLVGRRC